MKNKLQCLVLVIALMPIASNAQQAQPFNDHAFIDINKFNARQNVHGDMWLDYTTIEAQCEFPKNSNKNVAFAGALWMSGYDQQGALRVSAQTYRQFENDYWPGPIQNGLPTPYATSQDWAKVWKLNRSALDSFKALSAHTIANTPATILTWPAKGNPYAAGKNNAPLSVLGSLAPFVDVDNNGTYDPLAGDYPEMKGDQMLWNVFSDFGAEHSQTQGSLLKIELRSTVYAYNRNSDVDNMVFYEYELINKGTDDLDSFRIGLWTDVDLGYYRDDYIGFDSSRNLGIVYNGIQIDGQGEIISYGANIPIAGIRILESPEQGCNNYKPAGSFSYFNNNSDAIVGNPSAPAEYNNYLRSRWRNGQLLVNDFQNGGTGASGIGTPTNYVFTGDPSNPNAWSECALGNPPDDRRFIITSHDTILKINNQVRFAFALLATNPDTGNACPVANFQEIGRIADTALKIYCNPLTPPPAGIFNITASSAQLSIFPNPARQSITIQGLDKTTAVRIFDATGRLIKTFAEGEITLDVSGLSAGWYQLSAEGKNGTAHGSFVKP